MDTKTEQALRESIAKWEKNSRVRKVEDAQLGISACPLCAEFWWCDCVGCPVSAAVNEAGCDGTPYPNVLDAKQESPAAFRAAAREEVAFLKSLLPENNQ